MPKVRNQIRKGTAHAYSILFLSDEGRLMLMINAYTRTSELRLVRLTKPTSSFERSSFKRDRL